MDERQLIDRCIRGETGAWDRLVREYGSSVHDAARFTLRRVLGSALFLLSACGGKGGGGY